MPRKLPPSGRGAAVSPCPELKLKKQKPLLGGIHLTSINPDLQEEPLKD